MDAHRRISRGVMATLAVGALLVALPAVAAAASKGPVYVLAAKSLSAR